MKTSLLTLGIVGLLQTTSGLLLAEKAYPMLMSLKPTAAQRGSTSEHELESRYSMFGAYQVLVSGEGVTGEIVTPMDLGKDGKEPSLTKINVKFTVADDALPGVRDVRVVGPTGASRGTVTRTPITIEPTNRGTAQVVEGLSDGQEIVVSGASALADGTAVRRFIGFGD